VSEFKALEWFDFRAPDYSRLFQLRIDRLLRIRAQPECLPDLKAYYAENPAQFVYDWGLTHDPRNLEVGMPALVPFSLFPKQVEMADYIMRKWQTQSAGLIEKSRDVGASWLCMAISCALCLFRQDMVIGFGSRKEEYVDKLDDPKSLFFKARAFMRYLPKEFRGSWVERDAPYMRLVFRDTGSVITGEAGDNIGRGGRTSLYFVDEAAWLERPELVDASLSANTNCRIDLSSVRGMANPFAIKRFGGKVEVFTFHWRDDPRKNYPGSTWYEELTTKKLLSPVVIAQEYDIDYSASVEGVVIPSAWVQSAIGALDKLGLKATGRRRAALDVADEGLDLNAMVGREGVLLNRLESWSGKGDDIFGTVVRAFRHADEWGFTSFDYDADGLGAGVRGDARVLNEKRPQAKKHVIPWRGSSSVRDPERKDLPPLKNEDVFANLKAQEWWALRKRFQLTHRWVTEGVPADPDEIIAIDPALPQLAALTVELSQPTYSTNGAGKILIDKKPDGAKSPNLADAVMIAYAKGSGMGLNINPKALGKK
jgi:phage terminase large subunit